MVGENAERFGLSQLHQLRGRVGRGSESGVLAILLCKSPLGETERQRLDIIRRENNGFVIAEEDLKLRGSGELLGTRQTGMAGFQVADIVRDAHWLERVAGWAAQCLRDDLGAGARANLAAPRTRLYSA